MSSRQSSWQRSVVGRAYLKAKQLNDGSSRLVACLLRSSFLLKAVLLPTMPLTDAE
jgi:hypothetical protein